jgi:hypothetical protein
VLFSTQKKEKKEKKKRRDASDARYTSSSLVISSIQ